MNKKGKWFKIPLECGPGSGEEGRGEIDIFILHFRQFSKPRYFPKLTLLLKRIR